MGNEHYYSMGEEITYSIQTEFFLEKFYPDLQDKCKKVKTNVELANIKGA